MFVDKQILDKQTVKENTRLRYNLDTLNSADNQSQRMPNALELYR